MHRFAALLLTSGLASPAWSEALDVCFDPGTTQMTPAAYIAVRETAAVLISDNKSWPHVVLTGGRSESAQDQERIDQTLLELSRVGIGVGRVKVEFSDTVHRSDCLVLDVNRTMPPYIALWHFWGPYFDAGSTDVTRNWAMRMRFIVAGYRPGQTIYRVQGHADTAGGSAANMETSRRRADNVARELVRQGVRENDIVIEAFGETRLARATADGVAEPLNRRVTVDVRERPDSAAH